MEDIRMIFNENPSALYTLWKAFRSRKSRYNPSMTIPAIHAVRSDFSIDTKHLHDFYEICNISPSSFLHILYPFTLVFPYIMRVLCRKEMPLSLFKSLHTRSSIVMHRAILPHEHINIDCHNAALRIVPKGLEIDIKSVVSIRGENVWESISTFYFRGKFGNIETTYSAPKLEEIPNAAVIKKWHFPAKDRFRFAKVSGDTNGIHYVSFYARMMGFKRDFAQPLRVVAQCVSCLTVNDSQGPVRLDFHLKGPVYYESTLTLRSVQIKKNDRFDLYCSGNDKLVICGILHNMEKECDPYERN